jgi:hypothetical protein
MPKNRATASQSRKEFFGSRVQRANNSETIVNAPTPSIAEEQPIVAPEAATSAPKAVVRTRGRSSDVVAESDRLSDDASPKRRREPKISASEQAIVSAPNPLAPQASVFVPGSGSCPEEFYEAFPGATRFSALCLALRASPVSRRCPSSILLPVNRAFLPPPRARRRSQSGRALRLFPLKASREIM